MSLLEKKAGHCYGPSSWPHTGLAIDLAQLGKLASGQSWVCGDALPGTVLGAQHFAAWTPSTGPAAEWTEGVSPVPSPRAQMCTEKE